MILQHFSDLDTRESFKKKSFFLILIANFVGWTSYNIGISSDYYIECNGSSVQSAGFYLLYSITASKWLLSSD